VTYKPGVDGYGLPVPQAYLAVRRLIKGPDKITFNITCDVMKNRCLPAYSQLFSGEALVGEVSYDISERFLEFNSQWLSDLETAALAGNLPENCQIKGRGSTPASC
jgi:hypothetical protein